MAHTTPLSAPTGVPRGALHPVASSRLQGVRGRPDTLAVGVIIWLASELMFFAALFAAYFSLRETTGAAAAAAGTTSMWEWGSNHLLNDWFGVSFPWFATINTTILLLSSVTCQLGVHAAERGQVGRSGSLANVGGWGLREWYTLTFVMGAVFIGGQAYEYANLVNEGFVISTNAYTSAFFLATGFHGLHVVGGLVAFLLMLGRTYMSRRFTHEQAVHAIVTSYYWHFVDAIWVVLFGVLYLLR